MPLVIIPTDSKKKAKNAVFFGSLAILFATALLFFVQCSTSSTRTTKTATNNNDDLSNLSVRNLAGVQDFTPGALPIGDSPGEVILSKGHADVFQHNKSTITSSSSSSSSSRGSADATTSIGTSGGRKHSDDWPLSQQLTDDGAWCWFQDPRAIFHEDCLYTGWITQYGDVRISQYNLNTGESSEATLRKELEVNDHANPAILIRSDGRLMVFYCRHNDNDMQYRIANEPQSIASWSDEYSILYGKDRGLLGRILYRLWPWFRRRDPTVTYPNPFQLSGEEDRIYLFSRAIDWNPTYTYSNDNGITWSRPERFIKGGDRPYVKYVSDGMSKIQFVFTNGHPKKEMKNSVYYAYYKDGAYYRANHEQIKTLSDGPLLPEEADLVYDGSAGRAWVWDIVLEPNNDVTSSSSSSDEDKPVIGYTVFPLDGGTRDHRYRYAYWDGSQWRNSEVTSGGGWFPQTPMGASEDEPWYSGGMAIHPGDPGIVFVSREIDGEFEIERFVTDDGGETWSGEPVTANSTQRNVRPIVPRGTPGSMKDAVLFMSGFYLTYTEYSTGLRSGFDLSSTPLSGTVHKFDFGDSLVPLAEAGYHRVSEATFYRPGGYGWSDTLLNGSRERKSAAVPASDIQQSFVFNSLPRKFIVEVEPGMYRAQVMCGDAASAHDNTEISANGQVQVIMDTDAGQWKTSTFEVDASSGEVAIQFRNTGAKGNIWVVNSLILTLLP